MDVPVDDHELIVDIMDDPEGHLTKGLESVSTGLAGRPTHRFDQRLAGHRNRLDGGRLPGVG
jgi:hypothetical protein